MPAYRAVYENLTGKKVVFEYLVYERSSELVMQRKFIHTYTHMHLPAPARTRAFAYSHALTHAHTHPHAHRERDAQQQQQLCPAGYCLAGGRLPSRGRGRDRQQ